MDKVHNLENTVAGWYKNVPHLPREFSAWIADNIWWLVVIGVVVSVFGLFAIIPIALIALGFSSGIAATYGVYDSSFGGAWISIIVSVISLIVVTILETMAINPLRAKVKKGWTLLFIVALVNVVLSLVSGLVVMSVFSILSSLLWAAVHGYFLFEIRSYFGAHAKVDHKPLAKAKKV